MIERISKEQADRMPEFVRKWTDIGLSTGPADRPSADRAIGMMYAGGGLAAPKIVWCGSPLGNGLARAVIDGSRLDRVGASVRDSVGASAWDSVGASVRASVRASVGASVWDSVGDSGYGQHDADWLAFYRYFNEVIGLVEKTAPLVGMWELAESAGWWLPHEHICWISERPVALHRDAQGRLHAADRLAIEYPDGWGVYAWHGVRVPARVIERPMHLSAQEITTERNAEVRRVMLTRYGEARYLLDVGAKAIATDDTGTLYRQELAEDEPLAMVRVENRTPEADGTCKPYWLRVPPSCQTAREAVAWTFAKGATEYQPAVES